jgi:hypothetical protein
VPIGSGNIGVKSRDKKFLFKRWSGAATSRFSST